MIEVRRYVSASGKDVFGEWFERLADLKARARIAVRIDRLSASNFGDAKALGGGLHELRIDTGPGYRVYYSRSGKACILLLCGGDKRSQTRDIERARKLWADYVERAHTHET